MDADGRTCLTCGVFKLWDDFALGKGPNGRRGHCKPCHSAKNAAYNKTRPDKAKAATDAWRERNKERVAEVKRKWVLEHPDLVAAQKRRSHERNRETNCARVRAWVKENPEKRKQQSMLRRVLKTNAAGAWYTTQELIEQRVKLYGGACFYCGGSGTTIDHRIPLARGGSHWPSNLVPACRRCNSRKNARSPFEFMKEVIL
jgi:5-methylcytosine-specific restriction endonuclease McrA